jgi:hypothetical protein
MSFWMREIALWIREIAGWLLIGLGLLVFLYCLGTLEQGKIWEAGPQTLIGIIIFRGGIHLLKVAVAARVCLRAQEQGGLDRTVPKAAAAFRRS